MGDCFGNLSTDLPDFWLWLFQLSGCRGHTCCMRMIWSSLWDHNTKKEASKIACYTCFCALSHCTSDIIPSLPGTHSWSEMWTCPSRHRWAAGTPPAPGGDVAPSHGRFLSERWGRRWPQTGSPAACTPAPAATGRAGPPAGCALRGGRWEPWHPGSESPVTFQVATTQKPSKVQVTQLVRLAGAVSSYLTF